MNFEIEQPYRDMYIPVCGIDEAGRGPLCGPVYAAAVILPDDTPLAEKLNDSKKISEKKREALFQEIMDTAMVGIGFATPEEIDELNILNATFLAMNRAVKNLPQAPAFALVDGNRIKGLPCDAACIVKGDAKCPSIAAASIVAKVSRDRVMAELSKEYPQYMLDKHKGYPTKEHFALLREHGVTPIYRKSFLKNL